MGLLTTFILLVLLFSSSLIVFIFTFICTLFSMHKGSIFMEYIYEKDYKKWEQLTSFGKFGPGVVNPFRSIPYLYSDEKSTNKKFQEIRKKAKFWTTLAGLGYGLLFLLSILMKYLMD